MDPSRNQPIPSTPRRNLSDSSEQVHEIVHFLKTPIPFCSESGEFLEVSCAVAQFLGWDSKIGEQRQLQVCQGSVLRVDEMAAAFDRSGSAAEHKRRQRAMGMAIAVADSSAI